MTQIVKCPLSSQMQNPPAKLQMQFHFILIYCSFLLLTQQLPNESPHHCLNACSQRRAVSHWHRASGFLIQHPLRALPQQWGKAEPGWGKGRAKQDLFVFILNNNSENREEWVHFYVFLRMHIFKVLTIRQVVDKMLMPMSRAEMNHQNIQAFLGL